MPVSTEWKLSNGESSVNFIRKKWDVMCAGMNNKQKIQRTTT